MEHKVVAAASMNATFKIQHSHSKCIPNCLSLTKKLHQKPVTFTYEGDCVITGDTFSEACCRLLVGAMCIYKNELSREN